ncbi:hypothetical protein [Caulobacter sp. NIBR2454]|uniref:hypothetical protein n=1 Tax=Caulobacter sp. NIBR2454 TaxID=3015996 RepID=UPI0022B6D5A1|nr:hypothetical protein [Caulobacter sp. NIBR2454]
MSGDQSVHRDEQSALAEFRAGPFGGRAEVRVTPEGIWAVAGLMTGILLSSAAIVWAAKAKRRAR